MNKEEIIRPYLENLKNNLKQDIQNGLIRISDGNEVLFAEIDNLNRDGRSSVYPKVKTGHWKLTYRECGTEFYLCSRCNNGRAVIDGDYYKSLDEFKICLNCGAKMESEDRE